MDGQRATARGSAEVTGRRIIYVLEPFPSPYGGVAIIYRHVEILMAHGFAAFVHMPDRPEVDFYETTAAQLIGNLTLNTTDVLVIPEILGWALRQFRSVPLRRLMFCQNHNNLPPVTNPSDALDEWGVHGVIASSAAIRDDLRDRYGLLEIPLIPCAVDPIRFAPARQKERQIAFMPRKLPADAAMIETHFKKSYPRFADVRWVSINDVSQAAAARVLSESSVFLSLSNRESLGLPPLEAMASGCLVAGYHGDGGREYITDSNGWWAQAGDWKACVDGLVAAFDLLDQGGKQLETRRQAMAQTVAEYSPQRMETALLAFWRRELDS
jgi:glycosyltransferase involved in cell wall biosynthesis